ncbi:GGDEF domain-containing protein [Undibacterium sp. SXout7W]|uniref:GGDEF domain-containing protein n=1 Tax=Undibacterium sp. SXout7W TaxID=3413049 RepID=UPI003BF1CC94
MNSIIKHLVEITGHRDHDLLNISVISALRELTQAESARVLDVVFVGTQILIKPQISIAEGGIVKVFHESEAESADEPVVQYDELKEAIIHRAAIIESDTARGKLIWLPVWINDQLHTCLEVIRPANYNANTKEVVGGMLIVYRNFQNLLDYSERDSLTGLLNRKTFDDNFSKVLRSGALQRSADNEQIQIEERRSSEPDRQHWLAVIDIDFFKRVNDQFGHLYGDEVLILIANILRSSFRPGDRLFRFGGEEFVVLLRSTSQTDAQHIFDRFRQNVEQHHFPQVGRVTVSVGYARIDPFEPAVAIVGRADQALYFAKTNGRNLTCYYDHLVSSGDLHAEHANDTAEFF